MSAAARIGVDVGGTKTSVIALGPDDATLFYASAATPSEAPSEAARYEAHVRAVAGLVSAAAEEIGAEAAGAPVGVGAPGDVDERGLMKNANSTWLIGRPFEADLAAALGRPTRVANDATCFIASEAADGAATGAAVAFGVILGTGVGGGVAFEGRAWRGANRLAGEWGHAPFPNRGGDRAFERCYCGALGCVETVLCGPALTRRHRTRTGATLRPTEIEAAAKAGDAGAAATLDLYFDDLAEALAPVVGALDPETLVFGGGVSRLETLYAALPERLAARLFHAGSGRLALRTRVARSLWGPDSGVRGAARLWPREGGADGA